MKNCEKLIADGLSDKDIKKRLKTRSSRNKNYWIERGYSLEESTTMANSRCPGTYEYYKIYKGYTDEDKILLMVEDFQKSRAITLDNLIRKYGEVDGKTRWDSYRKKQSNSNSYEYKKEKYGWSEEKFKNYNKSRAVTLENLQKKHGENVGLNKWESYCKRQSYTKSKDYFIDRFGDVDGEQKFNDINKNKSHTFDVYLERYDGDVELATEKLINFWKSCQSPIIHSKISCELFNDLNEHLIENGYKKIFNALINNEWVLNVKNQGTYFLDFYLRETGNVIEFYGDYWHCNPKKYKSNDIVNFGRNNKRLVSDVWENDRIRIKNIKKMPYIKDVLIVWESDYRNDRETTFKRCIDFLIK